MILMLLRLTRIIFVLLSICLLLLVGAYSYCIRMPGVAFTGDVPALTSTQKQLHDNLVLHVDVLAEQIGERHHEIPDKLVQTSNYIREQLSALGYEVTEQVYSDGEYRNLVVEIPGSAKADEIIVVGAHYDTTWLTAGADDNASGVAGLIELARMLKDKQLDRTIRFIAFANEEAPFFGTDQMGSMVSAQISRRDQEHVVVMYSLEMIGYYLHEPNTQHYPDIIKRFYPDKANFIAFVGNMKSGSVLRQSVKLFRQQATIGSAGLIAPAKLVPDIQRSDNYAYWQNGFPAVMVTDTSNFRNIYYHTVGDVANTLDYASMTHMVSGFAYMLEQLASD